MLSRITLLFALTLGIYSCELNEQGLASEQDLLFGNWINMQFDDNLVTLTRSDSLITQEYGIKFKSDQTLIERKNAGWCGTPPVFHQDFDGSWSRVDSIININVDYWGGTADYKWKIVSLDEQYLTILRIDEIYNHESRYYYEEIFHEAYLDIYGDWQLTSVSGGIHGGGHELNFDYLEIKEYGQYRFIKADTILETGKIIIEEQTSESLRISLEADPGSEPFMYDSEKYVIFSGEDILNLNSPCCDRYNYQFSRKK